MAQKTSDTRKSSSESYWWRTGKEPGCPPPPRVGERCPQCKAGKLIFDGLFVLHCPVCEHVVAGGAFT